jgi:hypothetical protein
MREHLVPGGRNRSIASALLCAIAALSPVPALAQVASPGQPSTPGMGVTSPIAAPTSGAAGIPLGATEITVPGISSVDPAQATATPSCAGSDGAGPSAAPFDGGGLSGGAQLSCADAQNFVSPLASPSSVARTGIPLGATELGGAGTSPAAPVVIPGSTLPIATPANP